VEQNQPPAISSRFSASSANDDRLNSRCPLADTTAESDTSVKLDYAILANFPVADFVAGGASASDPAGSRAKVGIHSVLTAP